MKQKIEIEVDVPDDMEIKCQGSRNDLRPVITPTECTSQIVCNVILRRREPVRDSRWTFDFLHDSDRDTAISHIYRDRAYCCKNAALCGVTTLIRLDHEDGKLVRVELEEVSDG